MRVTFLILTYNGLAHLEPLMPTIREEVERTRGGAEVLVVENGNDPGSEAFMRRSFSEFRYEKSPVNDYLFSLNPFIGAIDTDYTVMLNNDMLVESMCLDECVDLLDADTKLFAVGCHMTDWERENDQSSVRMLHYSKGWYDSRWDQDIGTDLRYTHYAGGGSSIFRTSMLKALGGFNPLYRPAYAEDMDLGWRAWCRGWPSIYFPNTCIRHREGGTLKEQFAAGRLKRQIYANRIISSFRNGRAPGFLRQFLMRFPYRLIYGCLRDMDTAAALLKAIRRLPLALRQKNADVKPELSDNQIRSMIGSRYAGRSK